MLRHREPRPWLVCVCMAPIDFTRGMEGIDTIPGPKTDGQQTGP
jgi:hypothetical protein